MELGGGEIEGRIADLLGLDAGEKFGGARHNKINKIGFTFRIGDGSHGPFGCLVEPILVVSSRAREFDAIKLDIASWSS